ncbi:MAG: outer membrane protein assembly factor BamB family protein [Ktedonobacterales bacterium]
MASSHRRVVRRWCQPRLLSSVVLGTLLLSACTAAPAGTTATGGTLRWRFQTDGGRMDGLPTVANDLVYCGVQDGPYAGSVYALEASTGAVRWRILTVGQGSAPPAVVNGVIYVGSHDGIFSAQDARTGAVRWRVQTSGSEDASPAVANGVVYVGTGGSLIALDAGTGAPRWQFPPKTSLSPATDAGASLGTVRPQVQSGSHPYFAFSTPVVANGVVYADSEGDQSVYALDATTGALRWQFTGAPSDNEFPEAPAVEQGMVYVVFGHNEPFGSVHGSVYALEASTGAVRWRVHDSLHTYSAPAVADGVIYLGSTEGSVSALDAGTGAVRWRFSTGGPVGSLPVVANGVANGVASGMVYVTASDGAVYALNAQTGAQRWRFQTDGAQGMQPSPVVANGNGGAVYVSSSQFLYALNA